MNPQYRCFVILLLSFSLSNASFLDNYYLFEAYKSYQNKDYNRTLVHLKKIADISLQSQIILGDTYYRKEAYQKAIERYKSIQSTSIEIKQHLYYNIANAYVKLSQYDQARRYYAKVLQLGEDSEARDNLQLIALWSERKDGALGIANPKSQSSASTKSEKESTQDIQRDENQPSSASGGSKESRREKNEKKEKLLSSQKEENHPLGSKVYELINEGYIYEKQPW